jgi:hypothetical protein
VSPGEKLRSWNTGLSADGMRVKSGQSEPLKTLSRSVLDAGVAGPDGDRRLPPADDEVGEEREVLHVVEVAVGEDDVVHAGQRREVERGGQRAGVERERSVHEEAGAPAPGELTAVTAQHAEVHGSPNFQRSARNCR